VVTSSSEPGLRRRMAQSSPIPFFTALFVDDAANCRICLIKALSWIIVPDNYIKNKDLHRHQSPIDQG